MVINRRGLLATGALGALGTGMRVSARDPRPVAFPPGFTWGCATASYQIEGAVAADGRKPSNWDLFSHTPGKVANGDTGDVACDSYHRIDEDVALLKALGVGAYRFSVAWPRVIPDGRGAVNARGLDYYDRLVDRLSAAGIEPVATLFHWDLPAALPGGWRNRDTAHAFADYAGIVTARLSDRVRRFMTVNEMRCFTDLGHKVGIHAPGLKLDAAGVNQVRHHAVLAHGLGVGAVRAHGRAGTKVGLADNTSIYCPVMDTPEHVAAAMVATREDNAPFLTAVMEGRYLDTYLATAGAAAPRVEPGDMRAIGAAVDFVGLNLYAPEWVRAGPSPRDYRVVPPLPSSPRMGSPWLVVGPEVAYWGVRLVSELWRPKSILVSENGASANDPVVDGAVSDADRIMYLRNYLGQFARAAAEGYPLHGYFLWSLMDNFEWADGYTKRFGIHYVDFATQKRTPKLSAAWYAEVIRRNQLV